MKLITICKNINNSVLKEDYEFWTKMRDLYFEKGEEAVNLEIEANRNQLDWFKED